MRTSRKLMLGALTLSSALVAQTALTQTAMAQTASLDKSITVNGSGSTFVSNFIEQCKADVKKSLDINIAYQPVGSGAGRSGFINGTTDFGASDVPFTDTELPKVKGKFVYIPVTIGGIAVIYRLPGVTDLKLSAQTTAKIFAGTIGKWNDEAITRENPGVTLPSETIRVVVRSDSSGTSNVFSDYLASAGKGAWTKGAQSTFPIPAGSGIAQKGSDGVTNYLADQGNFGITYAETSFATERKLGIAKIINTAGNAVLPDPANVTVAMGDAAINDDGTLLLNFNTTKADAYPISTTAYLIAPVAIDAKKGDVLRAFLTYALAGCQEKAKAVGYAPLPKNLLDLSLKALALVNPGSAPSPTVPGAAAPAAVATTTPAAAPTTAVAPVTTKAPTATTKKATKAKKKSTKKTVKK